jgi:hypothetical protein
MPGSSKNNWNHWNVWNGWNRLRHLPTGGFLGLKAAELLTVVESNGVENIFLVVIQFAQDLSLRFEMTVYLACHFERIARNLSSLYSAIHSNCTTTHFLSLLTVSIQRR